MFNIFLSFLMIFNPAFAASPIIGGTDGPTFIAPLIMKEVTGPSSPAAGYQKVWISSVDGRLYRKTSAGTTVEVGPDITGKLDNPMTTNGDSITQAAGVPARVGIGGTNTVYMSDGSLPGWSKIVNASVDNSAAIAYSKLNLTGGILNADVNASAAIAYSKLNLSNSILNADVNASAAIDYSKLALSNSIVNADIATGAAIVDTKLATISTSGKVSNSATTATSSNTNSAIVSRDGSGNFSAGTVTADLSGNVTGNLTGAVTGNASTATALAANPAACSADRYVTDTAANGDLTCSQVTNAGLAGSIAASKLVGTDIATVGTITSGNWNGTPVPVTYGGTGVGTTSAALNVFLPTQTGNSGKFLRTDGTNSTWDILSGGTNDQREYITNGKAESDTSGWNTYADAAGASPVDGTSGTATGVTFTRTSTSSELIRQDGTFKLAKDASNRQGMGVSYDFVLDRQDFSVLSPVSITFEYYNTSGYDSGLKVFVYDKDVGTVLTVYDANSNNGAIQSSLTRSKFTGYFIPTTSTSDDYRLIFHYSTTNSSAYDFFFDSVHGGPFSSLVVPGDSPIGQVIDWPSDTCPANFIAASGATVSRTTYAALFAITGTTFGAGDGSTTFALPDIRGRVVAGKDDMGGSSANRLTSALNGDTLGAAGGAETHTLGIGEMPSHTHDARINGAAVYQSATGGAGANNQNNTNGNNTGGQIWTSTVAGSDQAHNNTQPTFILTKCIRYARTSNMMPQTEMLNQVPAPLAATSSTKTAAGNNWHDFTGNSITLTQGKWLLTGLCKYGNGGSSPAYVYLECGFKGADGADSASVPASVTSVSGLSVLNASDVTTVMTPYTTNSANESLAPVPMLVTCASSCVVYLTAYSQQSTAANVRATVYFTAQKQPDFTVFASLAGLPTQYTLSCTGTNTWVNTRCVVIPYQVSDGSWRAKFNFVGTHSSSASTSITLPGVTFKSGSRQSVSCNDDSGGSAPSNVYTNPGGSTVTSTHVSANTSNNCSGDVELDSKPTFVP